MQFMLPALHLFFLFHNQEQVAAHRFSAPFVPIQLRSVREWELETNPYYSCRIQDAMSSVLSFTEATFASCMHSISTHT